MSDHAYKPALLRGVRRFDLGEQVIVCTDRKGSELWRLEWDRVTGAALVEQSIGRSRIRRFELFHDAGKQAISYNGTRSAVQSPDSLAHLDLIGAILTELARRDPGMSVKTGDHGKSRWAMFVVGVFTLLMGLGLVVAMLATGVDLDRAAAALVPVLLLVATGGMVMYGYWPWRAVPEMPVGVLADALSADPLAGSDGA